jgi:hypothetical protein
MVYQKPGYTLIYRNITKKTGIIAITITKERIRIIYDRYYNTTTQAIHTQYLTL